MFGEDKKKEQNADIIQEHDALTRLKASNINTKYIMSGNPQAPQSAAIME